MWGRPGPWSPERYLRDKHPDVRIVEMELPGQLQGCVDHQKRTIWLSERLGTVQRRCTLAFELGQLEQGPSPTSPLMAAAHRRAAEDWAARLLIPTGQLTRAFAESTELPAIATMLQVDTPMLRARLRGLTDEEQDAVLEAIRAMRAPA